MRLVSYRPDGETRPGVIFDEQVYDVTTLLTGAGQRTGEAPNSTRQLLEKHGGELDAIHATLDAARHDHGDALVGALPDVELGPPVTDPQKVLCIGLNYRDHVAETGRELPKHPDVFAKFATSLTGPEEDLQLSQLSPKLDYEGELAIVIGTRCRNVDPDDALEAVAGAMILNDTTARDLQFNATQWLPGKALDASTPCGPALVTREEAGDIENLAISTHVNDTEVQSSNTSYLIFTIPQIISYISRFLELAPGDIISTGTPDGVGSRREPPSFLSPGDTVEVHIDGLGVLRNTIR